MSVEVVCFTDESSHGLNLGDVIKLPQSMDINVKILDLKKEIQQLLPVVLPLTYIQLGSLGQLFSMRTSNTALTTNARFIKLVLILSTPYCLSKFLITSTLYTHFEASPLFSDC
jgi:hypothetical protein